MRPRRSVRDRVLRAARDSPQFNVVQIATLVGCHRSTASKHLNRCHAAALALTIGERRRRLPDADPGSDRSPATLALLTRGSGRRRDVAGRPNCPPWLLVRLAADPDADVRRYVAGNGNCSASTLDRLAADPDALVRGHVAGNGNCPPRLLVRLADDPDRWVRRYVAGNGNCPPRLLVRLADDPEKYVRRHVAGNGNCSASTLDRLADDTDMLVRRAAICHPNYRS